MELISLKNVSRSFPNGEGSLEVLKGINIQIRSGECVGIVGVSGSGKSTLLNLIGILDSPSEGMIEIKGQNMAELTEKEKARLRAETIGFVFQSYHLEPLYTVFQNVEIPLLLTDMSAKERKKLVVSLLDKVGLADKKNKKAGVLSGGEKQRAAIARALVRNPEIILADEPCGNLDMKNSEAVMTLLRQLADEGKTVLVVTHDSSAEKYFDRIVTISDGRLV